MSDVVAAYAASSRLPRLGGAHGFAARFSSGEAFVPLPPSVRKLAAKGGGRAVIVGPQSVARLFAGGSRGQCAVGFGLQEHSKAAGVERREDAARRRDPARRRCRAKLVLRI